NNLGHILFTHIFGAAVWSCVCVCVCVCECVCVCVSPSLLRVSSAGSIVVDGHELEHGRSTRHIQTLRCGSALSRLSPHAPAVLVLLDVSPDQSMLDEGVSREVINRMTCSKPGHLVPSDEITVYYSCQPAEEYLDKVIQAHTDFIFSFKGVVLLENPKRDNTLDVERLKTVCCSVFGINALNAETDLMSLSGKTLTVTSGSSPADVSSSDSLLCPYVNMQLMNASPAGENCYMAQSV
uniref:Isoleucine--tRNA ligase cytoplasmic ubiquitin-like domain-containing protein n=1 Tax=Cyprinus carpio TaxID=7962 RepID=A0A8C2JJV7_CYPCA